MLYDVIWDVMLYIFGGVADICVIFEFSVNIARGEGVCNCRLFLIYSAFIPILTLLACFETGPWKHLGECPLQLPYQPHHEPGVHQCCWYFVWLFWVQDADCYHVWLWSGGRLCKHAGRVCVCQASDRWHYRGATVVAVTVVIIVLVLYRKRWTHMTW